MRDRERERERRRERSAENRAKGLTAKGKPRKGPHKPTPEQSRFFVGSGKPKPPKKDTTPEQYREKGRLLRTSPLASKIDDSIRRRLRDQ